MKIFSKKMSTTVFLFSIFIGVVINSSYTVQADELGYKSNVLLTETIPNDLVETVKARLPYFDSILLNDEGVASGNKSLGTAFSVYDDDNQQTYYYFPLYDGDGNMIKTIFCYNAEGAWQTNLSGYLVEELTRFVEEGSKTQGFVQKNADLYAIDLQNNLILFNDSPVSNGYIPPKDVTLSTYNKESLKQVKIEKNMYTFSNPVRKYSSSPSIIQKAEGQKYLNLDFLETQGSNNWCAAYVTTSIIRYANKSNSPTARQMMQHYYPNSSNLESQAASREKCMDYGYLHNFFNMVNVNSPITVSGTQLEINEESPFYIAASSDSTTATHAFTVRGYANFDFYQTISVWNPWSDASYGYDLMDPSSHTISTHGMVWKNFGTIYGWHHP